MADELFRAQGLAPVDVEFGFKPLPEDVHPDVESTHRLADAVIAALRERLDGDQISARQVLDPGTAGHHLAAQFMAEDDGVLDTGERMGRRAGGDRSVVVLVQIAAADAVVNDP